MKKRILAAFLAAVMLVSVVPVSVFADSSGTPAAQAEMDVKENTNQSDGVVMRKSVMLLAVAYDKPYRCKSVNRDKQKG